MQQQQGAAAVGGVVRDDHVGALRQVCQGFVLAGVGAEGLDVYAGYADQLGATALVEFIQVRLMLEEVGIQALLGNLHVRLHVVSEDLDVQLNAFFGQGRLNELEDFRVRYGSGRDAQAFGLGGEGCQGSECSDQFFHRKAPCGMCAESGR